jgi:MOSC domain-containing protein YiiM
MDAPPPPAGRVVAVHRSPTHTFSKETLPCIQLLKGLGVEGDAHCGATVKHCSRVAQDPSQPNLRQVHFIHEELFGELRPQGYAIAPGQLGENITTSGLDLLSLPTGTTLHVGPTAVVQLTGLRNPCAQIENFRKGLLGTVLVRGGDGKLVRKAGVMGVVLEGGPVSPGDVITVTLPPPPFVAMERV